MLAFSNTPVAVYVNLITPDDVALTVNLECWQCGQDWIGKCSGMVVRPFLSRVWVHLHTACDG